MHSFESKTARRWRRENSQRVQPSTILTCSQKPSVPLDTLRTGSLATDHLHGPEVNGFRLECERLGSKSLPSHSRDSEKKKKKSNLEVTLPDTWRYGRVNAETGCPGVRKLREWDGKFNTQQIYQSGSEYRVWAESSWDTLKSERMR